MSEKIPTVLEHDVWAIFFYLTSFYSKDEERSTCTVSKSYFSGDVWPQFVLPYQDGVLVGHMSFQEKKMHVLEWAGQARNFFHVSDHM